MCITSDGWKGIFSVFGKQFCKYIIDWLHMLIITLIAAMHLSSNEFAAFFIALNLEMCLLVIPYGVNIGLTTRIGLLLGDKNSSIPKKMSKYLWILVMLIGVILSSIIYFLKRYYIFTIHKSVHDAIVPVFYIICIYVIIDYIQYIGQGIIRSINNKQTAGIA